MPSATPQGFLPNGLGVEFLDTVLSSAARKQLIEMFVPGLFCFQAMNSDAAHREAAAIDLAESPRSNES
jgi:hypothetical protein